MSNTIMKLFHSCDWKATAVEHRNVGLLNPQASFTTILWRCKCGNIESTTIDGQWTLEQVRGERSEPAAENNVPAGTSTGE